MRTWTVTLPKAPPFSCAVRAFDEAEAIAEAGRMLGVSAEPCCNLEDEPCAECAADDALTSHMRAEDRGIDDARARGEL